MMYRPNIAGSQEISDLTEEISNQSEAVNSPNVIPETAAMFRQYLYRLPSSPALQSLLYVTADNMARRGIGEGSAVSGLRTTLVNYFTGAATEQARAFVDKGWTESEHWEQSFDNLDADFSNKTATHAMGYMFGASAVFLSAVTPVKRRYAIVETCAKLLADRFETMEPGPGIAMLDYGSSIMLGSLAILNPHIASTGNFKKASIRVGHSPELNVTARVNALKNGPQAMGSITCVDTLPVYYEKEQRYDSGIVPYALCGLNPRERNDFAYMRGVGQLLGLKESRDPNYNPSNVPTFFNTDFLVDDHFAAFTQTHPKGFDMIVANYVTQELSPPDQVRLHERFMALLKNNGVLMYNHQAYINTEGIAAPGIEDIQVLSSHANIAWSSECHIYDAAHPDAGLQLLGQFRNNRHDQLKIGPAAFMVDGKPTKLTDMICRS